ncbi:hypothetical protein GX48_05849 [Paracoccidioides brasiliensis]|nr:hypothetical protein GX48_05849 [Paracoccidioides brasiliensis]
MSTTTTLLVGDTASMSITSIAAKTTTTTTTATSGCPSCGFELRLDSDHAQRRISELEAQVKFLNKRAVETAEKLADYEDEIRFLRSKITNQSPSTPTLVSSSQTDNNNNSNNISNNNNTLLTSPPQHQQIPTPPSQSRLGTLASLLPYARRNAPTPPPLNRSPSPTNRPPISPSASSNSDNYNNNQSQSQSQPQPQPQQQPQPQPQPEPDTALQSALSREQTLRKQAESRLNQTNSELEELTAQLFCQANEMVAQERRARAKLEERVDVLERRDAEKRDRLDRLERAVERVERVRGMVG